MAYSKSKAIDTRMEVAKEIGKICDSGKAEVKLTITKRIQNDTDKVLDEKYDIRPWWKDANGELKYGKGTRLNEDEVKTLRDLLNEIDFDEFE